MGVIDALGLGFELVLRSLWVLVIPVALDLFFWLGPRLSVRPLFERLVRFWADNAADLSGLPASVEEIQQSLSQIGASFNLFGLLATDFMGARFLPLPVIKAFVLADADAPGTAVLGNPAIYTLNSAAVVVLLAAVLMAAGLLIGALYMTLVADRVRPGGVVARSLARRVLTVWFWYLCLGVALVAAYVAVSLAVSLVLLIVAALAPLLVIGAWVAGIWAFLYTWFMVYAIALGGIGPLRAFWWSVAVVRRNFNSVLFFILLNVLIMWGLSILWGWLQESALGSFTAIAGNAFIGSGLVAASFIFLQDRLIAWQESAARPAGTTPAGR